MANKATILNGSAHKGKQRQKKETTQPVHKETGISSEKNAVRGETDPGSFGYPKWRHGENKKKRNNSQRLAD